jgi:hypothetical protein
MQEGTETAQVTAQRPAEWGASNPDTGNGLSYPPKRPYWITMSHIFQYSKYMGFSPPIILPKCEIDHSSEVGTLTKCGAVFSLLPPFRVSIAWCLIKHSYKLNSAVLYEYQLVQTKSS